jgi:hypothetical protein
VTRVATKALEQVILPDPEGLMKKILQAGLSQVK